MILLHYATNVVNLYWTHSVHVVVSYDIIIIIIIIIILIIRRRGRITFFNILFLFIILY